jgi:tetratricopeptide (TPR) repeat protein
MNRRASILFNISSFSFSGDSAGEVKHSLPHNNIRRSIHAALVRSLYKQDGFESLGRHLVSIARHAYFARQITTLEQVSQLMLGLPISDQQKAVAHYYQAICVKRRGDIAGARDLLQLSLREAAPPDQAQVLLSLGATYFDSGEIELSLPYYIEAARAARDYDQITRVEALREVAIIRSIQGDHRQAKTELESLFPRYQAVGKYHPTLYYDFLNSLAVELGEVGRVVEAETICTQILASPFAVNHPHWSETRDELAAKRTAATPSVIVPAALETLPSPQAHVEPEPEPARARSTISITLRRSDPLARPLMPANARLVGVSVSTCTILDQLAYSTLPRSPPALS